MTAITDHAALLHAAVQDLFAGKRDAATRLPSIAERASLSAFQDLLRDEATRADLQAARLADAGLNGSGQANLWMKGILDDAERDGQQTAPGVLLDIALVGAVRKPRRRRSSRPRRRSR